MFEKSLTAVWNSVTGFGFTFEVVEDPIDSSPFKDMPKAVAVWIIYHELPDDIQKHEIQKRDIQLGTLDLGKLLTLKSKFIASITRETPVENRRWAISTLKSGWVNVIAVPTVEWAQFYEHRVYPAVPLTAGYRGNFTVSLRPRNTAARPSTPTKGRTEDEFRL